jgi:putative MATE family efflux protein
MEMKQQKRVGRDLTEGSILQGLIGFVLPIILANLIQQLYSMVDLIVIGKFVGNAGTVGVSTGGEYVDLTMPLAAGFSSAGQIYIAQLAGAKMIRELKEGISSFLTLMMLCSFVLMAGGLLFANQVLTLLNCPEEGFIQARNYMIWTAFGIPFTFGYNAVCGVLRGMGESQKPLLFITAAAITNIFLDLLLVLVIPLEAAGTAIATTLSQCASFLAAFAFMYKKKEVFDFELKLSYFKMRWEPVKAILGLGVPMVIRSTLVRVSMFWVNASVNSFGLIVSATNSIGNKMQKFLDIYSASFSQAASATIAQNLGAKKPERAKQVVLHSFFLCMSLATVVVLMIIFIPGALFGIFTNDPQVIDMGIDYLRIMIFHFYISAAISAFQAMVIGSANSSLNFVIGILDGVVCKIGLSLIFAYPLVMGAYGYFWGTALSRAMPLMICMFYYFSGMWKKRKLMIKAK